MSTNDVPGYNPKNADVLAMGCWGESPDGSLMFVEGVENGRVIYSMFDAAFTPVVEYRDAMPEKEFKTVFSWNSDRAPVKGKPSDKVPATIQWTWHDKTPFPWDRVIKKGAKDGARFASASDHLSDAQRVADSLALRGQKFSETQAAHMAPKTYGKVSGVFARLADRLNNLGA